MSQENVELVQRLYAAWRRDGFGVVPELMDPDIEWVNPTYAVEPGTRHGYHGFAAAAEAVLSVYGDYRVASATLYDAGDRVAVRARVSTRSLGNDVPIDADRGYVFDVRDGKVTRFAWFNDPAEALKAVGLAEALTGVAQESRTATRAELVRRGLEAVNRRDVHELLSYWARDVVYDTGPSGMGVYEGHDAVAAFITGYWDLFDELSFEHEELVDLPNGVTLSVNRQNARLAGSTAYVRTREAHVIEWDAETVVKITVYTDVEQARLAAERLAGSRG